MPSTYQKWVDELGVEGAKEKMSQIGKVGGETKSSNRQGFHTMSKSKLRKVSARGGKASRANHEV